VSIAANEGEDILQKIVDQGRTMGTFYAHGKLLMLLQHSQQEGYFILQAFLLMGKVCMAGFLLQITRIMSLQTTMTAAQHIGRGGNDL
jgi:hypothetical protein